MPPSPHEVALHRYVSSHNGIPIDPRELVKPNEMVKKIMIARFLSMTPQQRQSLRAILTPQTAPALNILLPGIVKLLARGVNGLSAR